jgi:hypothetical protein
LLAALPGFASALITFIFLVLVNAGQALVRKQLARSVGVSAPVFTPVICALGGLLVGVLVKILGDHSGIFAEMMVVGLSLSAALYWIKPPIAFDRNNEPDDLRFMRKPSILDRFMNSRSSGQQKPRSPKVYGAAQLRGLDSNQRPPGYERVSGLLNF